MARVVTSEPFSGWRTCGRPTIQDQDYGDAVRAEDCPSYLESQPCEVVSETVEFTFAMHGAKAAESAGMDVNMVERSTVTIKPADGNWACPDCNFSMSSFSIAPKPVYRHLSEQDPNELRRRSLRQDRQAEEQLSIAERSAIALERLAAAPQGEIAALREQIEALTARLEGQNGHDSDEAPEPDPVDPPKRRTAPRAA